MAEVMSPTEVRQGLNSLMDTLRGAPTEELEEVPDTAEALVDEQAEVESDEVVEDEEADEVEDEDAASTDEPEFSLALKVDGEDYLVTDRDEATRLAQLGKHFTKKNEALIAREQALEHTRAEVTKTQDQYVGALDELVGYLENPLGESPDERDFDDRQSYLEADRMYRQAHQAVQDAKAERDRVLSERTQQQQEQMTKWRQEQIQQAADKVPDWNDPGTWQAERESMREYAQSIGYTPQELHVSLDQLVVDHRQLLVLRDAMRYRRAQAAGAAEVKRTKTKEAAPGAGTEARSDGSTRRRKELHKRVQAGDKEAQVTAAGALLERQRQLNRQTKR